MLRLDFVSSALLRVLSKAVFLVFLNFSFTFRFAASLLYVLDERGWIWTDDNGNDQLSSEYAKV